MTSPDIASSIDDPSPKITELVDAALLREAGNSAPNGVLNPLHSYSGAITLKKLLPEFSRDTIYSLRDEISRLAEPEEIALSAPPTGPLIAKDWVRRFFARPELPLILPPDSTAYSIEVIEPIEGTLHQRQIKNLETHHAVTIRRSSLSGRFAVNGQVHEFNPSNEIIEVGRLSFSPRVAGETASLRGRRYYTYLTQTDALYQTKQYGGSMDETPIEDAALRAKVFGRMTRVLEEAVETL